LQQKALPGGAKSEKQARKVKHRNTDSPAVVTTPSHPGTIEEETQTSTPDKGKDIEVEEID